MLHRAQANYLKYMNEWDQKNVPESSKILQKVTVTIPTFLCGKVAAKTNSQKDEILRFFSSCFNKAYSTLTEIPPNLSVPSQHDLSFEEMYCIVGDIEQLSQSLEAPKPVVLTRSLFYAHKHYPVLICLITKLFNSSIHKAGFHISGMYLDCFLIHSPPKCLTLGNYRPISLICVLCKFLEKHV